MRADSSRIAPAGTAPLRADALHNRDRILRAAREAFTARGLDVPVAAIARRAGVGVATLYRRFPTRESLIVQVFADQLAGCVSVVDDALADPDPWRAFRTVIEKVAAMQVAERGFTAAFLEAFPGTVDFEAERVRAERGFAELVRQAKAAGRLRPDFARSDLTLLFMAVNGITADAGEAAPAAVRRHVAHLLRSFEADPAPQDGPAPQHSPGPRTGLDPQDGPGRGAGVR